MKKIANAIFVICLGMCTVALNQASAQSKLLKPIPESQSLIIENNNMSAADFYAAYSGKDVVARRHAEMYLLGVLDATEGLDWCDYRTIQTITVDEAIFTGFKKLDGSKMKLRASAVIRQVLASKFKCKVAK